MPCVNRVRIINFSYNNDARHIMDETFHFHGGENALMNLANGGGKSVLVQIMLQPIVPRARIQNRSIAEFFKKKKTPSYILVEWKLDDAGGYLLTGIALAPVETRAAEDEEKGRIRLFCFLSRYTQTNAYDLANIDLVRHEDGLMHITTYKQAQEMMQEAKRKDPLNISYFPQDELEEHRRKLSQFGISQDEWKHVMVRINDSEGGLEEIFSKCRTSDQLLNEWLIRTIDKGLAPAAGKGPDEDRSLQLMFENLLNETINSEEYLQEQQLLKSFSPKFEGVREQTAQLAGMLESRRAQEVDLAAMSQALLDKAEELSERKKSTENELESIGTRSLHIDREESSFKYYQTHGEWVRRDAEKILAQNELDKAETSWKETGFHLKLMKGAGLKEKADECKAQIAALNEKITDTMENKETESRMNRLKASLMQHWRERVKLLSDERKGIEERLKLLTDRKNTLMQRQTELEKEKSRLLQEQSSTKTRLVVFEADEDRICGKLNIHPARNLAGELSDQETGRIAGVLDKRVGEAEKSARALEQEEGQVRKDILQWQEESVVLDGKRQELNEILRTLASELEVYRKATESYQRVLAENGLPVREGSSTALAGLNQMLYQLRLRISQTEREIHTLSALAEDLRFGRYHVQGEWIQYLANANIKYQTGEDYLRKLKPGAREQMLRSMPLLPYSLLLASDDLAALPEAIRGEVQRSVIPIMTYDALKYGLFNGSDDKGPDACRDRVVECRSDEQNSFLIAALYNHDALDPDSVESLLSKTERQCKEMKESLENLQSSQLRMVKDIQVIEAYSYTSDWKNEKETRKAQVEKSLSGIESQISETKGKREEAEKRSRELLANLLPKARSLYGGQQENAKAWNEHIAKNSAYETDRRQLAANAQIVIEAEKESKAILDEQGELDNQLVDIRVDLDKKQQQEQIGLGCLREYEGSAFQPEETCLEGTCEELEAYLKELKSTQGSVVQELEGRLTQRNDELKKHNKDYNRLNLPGDTVLPRYDADSEERLEQEKTVAEKKLEGCRLKWNESDKAEEVAKTRLGHAREELLRTGLTEPLEESDIYGDFNNRRHELKRERDKLTETGRQLEQELNRVEKGGGRIADAIDLSTVKSSSLFALAEDWEKQMDQGLKNLKSVRDGVEKEKSRFSNVYNQLRAEFGRDNSILGSLFEGLDAMLARASDSYEPFFYLYERMTDHAGILAQEISMLNTRLESLDKNRTDVVQHCWFHGGKIYEELQRIEQRSTVKLEGRTTPVSMLKLHMELDSADAARLRMQAHIEKSLQNVREEFRAGKNAKEIRSSIDKLIHSRELLNVYLGTTRIPVQVYKIDINMRNSGSKVWEDAVRENSGGEKFVIYFAVLSALMAYSRAQEQAVRSGGEDAAKTGMRVLIMDNPFGPISSQHLLKPLFDIAKRYRTQLICLTDLKQSSILNNFNLVYMLRVRRGAASNNEYLKFEQYKRSDSVEENDESLEKAFYRVSDYKQMQMWE